MSGYKFFDVGNELKKLKILCLLVPLIVMFLFFYHSKERSAYKHGQDSMRLIAHAGGEIDGNIYTNSLEALTLNYEKGFRVFELDIIKTSDGEYVAAHSWEEWKSMTEYPGEIPPSLNDFKSFKLLNVYTPLSMRDINAWFALNKDAILVTDKINEPSNFSRQFIDKKRLGMEVFTWEAFEEAVEEEVSYPIVNFNLIRKLYFWQRNVDFLKAKGVKYLAASRNYKKGWIKSLNKEGFYIYAFTVGKDLGDEVDFFCEDMSYFYGLYADDYVSLKDLVCK